MVGIISGNTTYGPEFLAGILRSEFKELSESEISKVGSMLAQLASIGVGWVRGMVLRGTVETKHHVVNVGTMPIQVVDRVTCPNPLCFLFTASGLIRCEPEDLNSVAKNQLVVTSSFFEGLAVTHLQEHKKKSSVVNRRVIGNASKKAVKEVVKNVTGEATFKLGSNRNVFRKRNGKVKTSKSKFVKRGEGRGRSTKGF